MNISAIYSQPVELDSLVEPMFIGSWTRVGVKINDPSIFFDDLDFLVEPKESGAMISLSRDASFDPSHPNVMLIAGWMAGKHELNVIDKPSGNLVGQATFQVTDTWLDAKQGPSIAVLGQIEAGPTAGTWGGGDPFVPQNSNIVPALGTRNVAVVLVDTLDARYPVGAALNTIISDLRDEMVNGVNIGGQLRSVATYFDQASGGAFSINLIDIVGPIALPNSWATYFTGVNKDDNSDGVTDWVQWSPTAFDTLTQTIVAQIAQRNLDATNAGNPLFLDLSQVDSLVFVLRTVPANPPATPLPSFVWPRATIGSVQHIIGTVSILWLTVSVARAIGSVFMPDNWATIPQSGRRFHETVAHELGHNLQLNDQYWRSGVHDPAFQPRIADANPNQSWELMSWEEDLPLPSAAHRMMLGWLRPEWVRLYSFGTLLGPVDEHITLHAASLGGPPSDRWSVAEIRVADGRNYYFEFRNRQGGRIVDQAPPQNNVVFATDVTSRGSTPANRPEILRLREDADADRSEFPSGTDYEEADTTSPGFPNDFVMDVTNVGVDSAKVRIRYGLDQEPDPALTPWSAGSNWQSPDLEVRNARSAADPTFKNVPWEGHANTVVARVTNRGRIDANNVRVNFAFKDFTFASGAETSLGTDIKNVPVGASVEFTAPTTWLPPVIFLPIFGPLSISMHYCIVARIEPYTDPTNPLIVEVSPDNNEAQSNYNWMASTTSSPSTREVTAVLLENPYPVPARISLAIHQPHPLFRTYLSHTWLYLEPGDKQHVLVMAESLLGDPRLAPLVRRFDNRDEQIATTLRLSALADTGDTCAPTVLGGIAIRIIAARATQFERFEIEGKAVEGFITAADTGEAVDGNLLISVRSKSGEIDYQAHVMRGYFRTELEEIERPGIIQGHYLGNQQFGPCDSKEAKV